MRRTAWLKQGRTQSFTLIEILVVMAIIIVLTGILAMGLGGSRDKAAHKATKALINKIKVALESYNSEFRDYPPDGYDNEGWGAPWTHAGAAGQNVGYPPRPMRGSGLLMYFLCRPLIKITVVGADPNDPRNLQMKRVGPFLQLAPGDFSKEGFNPNHPWSDVAYWDTQLFRNTEIIDAYGRPICYDKVKVNDGGTTRTYFQPDRFQSLAGAGKGKLVHSDQEFLLGKMAVDAIREPEGYEAVPPLDMLNLRHDPRFANKTVLETVTTYMDGGAGAGFAFTADATNLAPKNVGGYDLWSPGRSWIDPRDDVTSWGD